MRAWFSKTGVPPMLEVHQPDAFYFPAITRQLAVGRALGALSGSQVRIGGPHKSRVVSIENGPCMVGVLGLDYSDDGPFVVAALSRARINDADTVNIATHFITPGKEADCIDDGCVHIEVADWELAVRSYSKGERVRKYNEREANMVIGKIVAALTVEELAVDPSSCGSDEAKYFHMMGDTGHVRMPEPAGAAVDMILALT